MPEEKSLIEKIKGWLPLLSLVGIITLGAGLIYKEGQKEQFLQDRILEPEQKVRVVTHVNNGPSAADEVRADLMDSLNTASAIKSRALRDSILLEISNRQRVQDSINLLNADQIFQIKEEFKNRHNE